MRNFVRYIWRHFGIKSAYQKFKFNQLLKEWRVEKSLVKIVSKGKEPVVLIIPPDPLLVTSSKGDEAMLLAVMAHCRSVWDSVKFVIVTNSDIADKNTLMLGATPCRALDEGISLETSIARLSGFDISQCVTIGADVLDGSYDPLFSGRILCVTDLIARAGIPCIVTGFSFSKMPYSGLKNIYDEFDSRVVFNLRDPASYERFKNFTTASANLVADVAFLLVPNKNSDLVLKISSWVNTQRANGRKVIGVNIHPLLLDLNERHNLESLVSSFSNIMAEFLEDTSTSLLFMEHDFRGTSSDIICLKPVFEALSSRFSDFLYMPSEKLSAAELKGVAGLLDGIVTGRMHLMIASLGMGTPVFCLQYKDKMEGLLRHFEMGTKYLATAKDIMEQPKELKKLLNSFLNDTDELRNSIVAKKDDIRSKSMLNVQQLK